MLKDDIRILNRLGELTEWFKERGYEKSLVQHQIDRIRGMGREDLIRGRDKQENQGKENRVSLFTTYSSAVSCMMRVVQELHPMLKSTEEHRKVFLSHLS